MNERLDALAQSGPTGDAPANAIFKLCVSVTLLIFGARFLIVALYFGLPIMAMGEGGGLFFFNVLLGGFSVFLAVKTRREFRQPWAGLACVWLALLLIMTIIFFLI